MDTILPYLPILITGLLLLYILLEGERSARRSRDAWRAHLTRVDTWTKNWQQAQAEEQQQEEEPGVWYSGAWYSEDFIEHLALLLQEHPEPEMTHKEIIMLYLQEEFLGEQEHTEEKEKEENT